MRVRILFPHVVRPDPLSVGKGIVWVRSQAKASNVLEYKVVCYITGNWLADTDQREIGGTTKRQRLGKGIYNIEEKTNERGKGMY